MIPDYLAPTQLAVTPTRINSVLLLGNCMFDLWIETITARHPEIQFRHSIFDYAESMTATDTDYDLRIIQLPLRIIYPEMVTMQNRYGDLPAYEAAFRQAISRMRALMGLIRNVSPDRPTFFLNYLYPQQNAIGRLLPRYDLRNPTFFIQRLNRELYDLVADFPGGHVLDLEQVAGTFGRRFVQDDAVWLFSHAGTISDDDWHQDGERLETEAPYSQRYPVDVSQFILAAWGEAGAMLRTLRGTDRIKMICIDLDDTLWRGVLAEQPEIDHRATEGWPIGFAEALLICKQRGIILAIASKNDEAQAAAIMERAFQGRMTMADFAIRKINWHPKPQNVAEAIKAANVLPSAVVYIDDNPVERAAVKALLPTVRLLGAPHLDWRRILLWSPETQVSKISEESASRTQMVQAQVQRDQDLATHSYADFLADLGLKVELGRVTSTADPQFSRALELINKTNQFNTTGDRWTEGAVERFFSSGGQWRIFRASDRYTAYGLVGVVVQQDNCILQFVMSCRVFGLQIERAVLSALRESEPTLNRARLIETPKNGPCREIYQQAGWKRAREDEWLAGSPQTVPAHVTLLTDVSGI